MSKNYICDEVTKEALDRAQKMADKISFEPKNICKWMEIKHLFPDGYYIIEEIVTYKTSCEKEYKITKPNDYNFCPYCGDKIEKR